MLVLLRQRESADQYKSRLPRDKSNIRKKTSFYIRITLLLLPFILFKPKAKKSQAPESKISSTTSPPIPWEAFLLQKTNSVKMQPSASFFLKLLFWQPAEKFLVLHLQLTQTHMKWLKRTSRMVYNVPIRIKLQFNLLIMSIRILSISHQIALWL